MTLHMLHINRLILIHFRTYQEVVTIQKCSSIRWLHSGSWRNNDVDIFSEDTLEEKINDGPLQNPKKLKAGKRLSAKKEAELQYRRYVKRKIIEKKEKAFYGQKQPVLLTWAAKSQIAHLNEEDPIYWTPEMLAQSFPVSRDVIIKILKNFRKLPPHEKFILEHDRIVYMNLLQLRQAKEDLIEGRPVDPVFRSIIESDKLNLIKNAAGTRALSVPVSGFLTKEALAEKRRPKTKGEFSAILEDYQKQKEKVKEVKKVKHIELEDPNYVALLKSISEMSVSDSVTEEQSDQGQTTFQRQTAYQGQITDDNLEELFYDEYDDNKYIDEYRHSKNDEDSSRTIQKYNDDFHKVNRQYNRNKRGSFSGNSMNLELGDRQKRNYVHMKKKDTQFQKSITKWVKDRSKDV